MIKFIERDVRRPMSWENADFAEYNFVRDSSISEPPLHIANWVGNRVESGNRYLGRFHEGDQDL